jgi:hypothetical protein
LIASIREKATVKINLPEPPKSTPAAEKK